MNSYLSFLFITVVTFSSVDEKVYSALQSNSLEEIELALIHVDNIIKKQDQLAYKGTLQMKKADYLKSPKEKLKVFKSGHELLESAITKEPLNIEYRFLRLSIQEHAPKIVGYNDNIEEDKAFIIAHYKHCDQALKLHIKYYAEESKILALEDLEG